MNPTTTTTIYHYIAHRGGGGGARDDVGQLMRITEDASSLTTILLQLINYFTMIRIDTIT